MEREIDLRIVLVAPPPGVDFALQKGKGNDYEVDQTQRSGSTDLRFTFSLRVREGKDGGPNFLGPFAQGTAEDRFVYLDIGTFAGQRDTEWSRRLKIPLRSISWELIDQLSGATKILEARVIGKGRDGGPSCGTAKPFDGWIIARK